MSTTREPAKACEISEDLNATCAFCGRPMPPIGSKRSYRYCPEKAKVRKVVILPYLFS